MSAPEAAAEGEREGLASPHSETESEHEIERRALLDAAPDAPVLRPLTAAYRARLEQASLPELAMPRAEKLRLEAHNRNLLEEDLYAGRTEFRSRPRVVELQLSNFCNMSCTMCYDGENPKLLKLDEKLVLALAEDLFPTASVFIPFATSEPLIVTWDLTKRLAMAYDVELELTTNVQFLDEKKTAEVEPHIGLIAFSIDSHLRDVYESIRLNSRPDKVFANLPIAAKTLGEKGVEVVTNVVFMVENAPFIDRTVAWLADQGVRSVHIQKLFYNKPRTAFSDPTVHFSKEWIDWMKERVRRVAREKRIKVSLDFDHHEVIDCLPPEVQFRANRTRDIWLERLRRHYPGYCPQSIYRFKVDADGNAYPCCVGVGERLKLGNLYEQSFEEIWNGPSSQDLRRGMLTQDLPVICRSCNFRTGPIMAEVPQMPFCDLHFVWLESHSDRWTIPLLEPDHLARLETPPTIRWGAAPGPVDRYEVVLSRGGEAADLVVSVAGDQRSWTIPSDVWNAFPFHLAFWWSVWGINDADRKLSYRGHAVRALIRRRDLPRVPGSALEYEGPSEH